MASFLNQIKEDIREYQNTLSNVPEINRDEWAFNYWVLDKFFREEDELILDHIVDNQDNGIDCYEWYNDTKELFLIQNKYYGENTPLSKTYVKNTFLVTPLAVLQAGSYTRSPELQRIYTNNKDDERFMVHLQIYVTNDNSDPEIIRIINSFNQEHSPGVIAEAFFLSDIERKWYEEPKIQTTTLTTTIESVNSDTILSIKNSEYQLNNNIDAKYVLSPITCLYNMVKEANDKGYPLFEKNIREYLGNRGINKNIYQTLKNVNERKYFFYYNNGVTLICDKICETRERRSDNDDHITVEFDVENPQIVNGCQTVNSIYTALKESEQDDLVSQYRDAFVMLKVLQIDPSNSDEKALSKKIVTYNNSQNSIDEKSFVANMELFQRIKAEFESKGFLLLTKQSDKNTFAEKYRGRNKLISLLGKSIEKRRQFGLESLMKVTELEIPLEKLLQVILAFKLGGLEAFTQKKDVLKPNTETYNAVIEFIKSSSLTTDVLLTLYLFYLRTEREKNTNSRGSNFQNATPIPFYAVDAFSKYVCDRDVKNIIPKLSAKTEIDKYMRLFTMACNDYSSRYLTEHRTDYIKMIKADIDYPLLKSCYDSASQNIAYLSANI